MREPGKPRIRMNWTRRIVTAGLLATAAVAVAGASTAQDLERGEALFGLCSTCHGDVGEGNHSIEAPAIAGLPSWYVEAQLEKFRTGIRGGHPEDSAGLRMRPMSRTLRSKDDVRAVAAFVASLPPVRSEPELEGGDAARGASLYALCGTCHGLKGEGNAALFGPPLAHLDDWYQMTQIHKYKAGIRAGDPRDTNGLLMRPMAMTLADDQAIKDVIAHILTLSN